MYALKMYHVCIKTHNIIGGFIKRNHLAELDLQVELSDAEGNKFDQIRFKS